MCSQKKIVPKKVKTFGKNRLSPILSSCGNSTLPSRFSIVYLAPVFLGTHNPSGTIFSITPSELLMPSFWFKKELLFGIYELIRID